MKANQYYSSDDSEMADVIIEAQNKMYQAVAIALNSKGYGTSDQEVEDAVKELCRVTLA
jgi:hypothetical protein